MAGSNAYLIAEIYNWKKGLYQKWHQAFGFYNIIILSIFGAVLLNFIKISPIKGLVYSSIFNGMIAPILLFFILKIGSNKKIMGAHVNTRLGHFFFWLLTVLMALVGVVSFLFIVFDKNN